MIANKDFGLAIDIALVVDRFNKEIAAGDIITPADATRLSEIQIKNLYYHIDKGNLPVLRVGGEDGPVFIRRTDFMDFCRERGFSLN